MKIWLKIFTLGFGLLATFSGISTGEDVVLITGLFFLFLFGLLNVKSTF